MALTRPVHPFFFFFFVSHHHRAYLQHRPRLGSTLHIFHRTTDGVDGGISKDGASVDLAEEVVHTDVTDDAELTFQMDSMDADVLNSSILPD